MKKQGQIYISAVVLMLSIVVVAAFAINMAHAQQATRKSTRTSIAKAQAYATTTALKNNHHCWWYCSQPTPIPTATASAPSGSLTPTPTVEPATPTAVPVVPTPLPTQEPAPTATPASGAGYTNSSAAAQAVLTLINQERAGMNLPALQMSNALINSAHLHNLKMLAADQLSHQLPGEADLGTRISAQGVKWTIVAENIGYGFGDATQTAVSLNQSMFAEKPPNDGHRQNILSNANIIGIDVIVNTQNSQVWLTEDFARTA